MTSRFCVVVAETFWSWLSIFFILFGTKEDEGVRSVELCDGIDMHGELGSSEQQGGSMYHEGSPQHVCT